MASLIFLYRDDNSGRFIQISFRCDSREFPALDNASITKLAETMWQNKFENINYIIWDTNILQQDHADAESRKVFDDRATANQWRFKSNPDVSNLTSRNVVVICLPTKHLGARKLVKTCSCAPDVIRIWKCWFFVERGKPEYPEKTSRSKDENQQQTQPTYDTGTGSRARATLVGVERCHPCAIHARKMSSHWRNNGIRTERFASALCQKIVAPKSVKIVEFSYLEWPGWRNRSNLSDHLQVTGQLPFVKPLGKMSPPIRFFHFVQRIF